MQGFYFLSLWLVLVMFIMWKEGKASVSAVHDIGAEMHLASSGW